MGIIFVFRKLYHEWEKQKALFYIISMLPFVSVEGSKTKKKTNKKFKLKNNNIKSYKQTKKKKKTYSNNKNSPL